MKSIRQAKRENDEDALVTAQQTLIKEFRRMFIGSLLRRTIDSHDWKGGSLINLPPCIEIMGLLKMTARETTIIHEEAEKVRDRYVERSRFCHCI